MTKAFSIGEISRGQARSPIGSPYARAGTAVGQGLGQALEAYTHHKLNTMKSRQDAQDLSTLLKIPIEEAQAAINLGIDKNKLINSLFAHSGGSGEAPMQDEADERYLEDQLNKNPEEAREFVSQEGELQKLRQRTAPRAAQTQTEALELPAEDVATPQMEEEGTGSILRRALGGKPLTLKEQKIQQHNAKKAAINKAEPIKEKMLPAQGIEETEIEEPLTPKEQKIRAHNAKKAIKEPKLEGLSERAAKAKMEKYSAARQKEINKETDPYVNKIIKDYDFAEFSEPRFKAMKKLVKEGGLPISSMYTILKNLEETSAYEGAKTGAAIGGVAGGTLAGGGTAGVGTVPGAIAGAATGALAGGAIGAMISPISTLLRHGQRIVRPNTEKYEKLQAQFLRGAKEVFGGRFTNEEMKAYLEMVPKLSNTDKGKLEIIDDFELFNKAARIKREAYLDILEENNGRRPSNLIRQIEKRTKKELDELADIFRKDIKEYEKQV